MYLQGFVKQIARHIKQILGLARCERLILHDRTTLGHT